MKNKYLPLLLIGMLCMQGLNAQFGPDVKTFPNASFIEGSVSMDISYNGWIYESFSIQNGFVVVMSKDNGDTWQLLDSVTEGGCGFNTKIVVAGTDSNYLRLHQIVDKRDSTHSTTTVYVNIYDASGGGFITNNTIATYSGYTRGIAIATDYKFPAEVSAPYSIGVAYGQGASYDSLWIAVSTDSGYSYNAPIPFAATPRFFHKVSLAYGRSASWSDGRFFLAWEQFNGGSDTAGNLYTAYTPTDITDVPAYTVNLDSLYPTTAYQLHDPVISCSLSSTVDNDSSNITELIAVERSAPGFNGSNILEFVNMSAVYGNYWTGLDVVNTVDNTKQADLSFDPGYNNFLLTYYDATINHLPYIVNNFNTIYTDGWGTVTNNYADDTTKLISPWPTVRINPVYTRVGLGWTNTYSGVPQAMFDAEYREPVPVLVSLSPDTVIAGNSTFTLQANGAKFSANSYIMWNTDSLGATFVNSGQLTASVSAGMVSAAGTVPVTVVTPTINGGGGTTSSVTFYIVNPLAIANLGPNSITVYPNPASTQLTVAYAFSQAGKMELSLYDMSGRLVKDLSNLNVVPGTGTVNADVTGLSQGLYQLVINTAEGSTTRRISIIK